MHPEQLFHHRDFVRAIARQLLLDEHQVDDVEQQTWIAATERAPAEIESLPAWLAACARNFARQLLRGEARRGAREREAARTEAVPSSEEILALEETRRQVVRAVLDLGEHYRTALVLRHYEGLSYRAVAARLGVPVETVRTRLRRGHQLLRERLREEHGGDRQAFAVALSGIASTCPSKSGVGTWILTLTTMKILLLGSVALVLAFLAWSPSGTEPAVSGVAPPTPGEVAETHPLPQLEAPAEERVAAIAEDPGVSAAPAFFGRVVDGEGVAVEGSRVTLFPETLPQALDPEEAHGPRILTARTDAAGRFRVRAGGGDPYLSLRADARGFAPAILEGVRPGEELLVRLETSYVLAGTLSDASGAPISGGRVRVVGLLAGSLHERAATSDAEGRWSVPEFPLPGRTSTGFLTDRIWIEARADGFAPLLLEERYSRLAEERTEPGPGPLDLELTPGNRLTGRVVVAEGRTPIPDARVVLWSVEGELRMVRSGGSSHEAPLGQRLLAETYSGGDGSFTFERLPARGRHRSASHSGGEDGRILGYVTALVPGQAPASAAVHVAGLGEELEVEVRCWPAAGVRGRVVDESGAPVAGAFVRATCEERPIARVPGSLARNPGSTATTDAAGAFELVGLPAESRPGAEVEILVVHAPSAARVETRTALEVGKVTEMGELTLPRRPALRVLVADVDGVPVWDAVVTADTDSALSSRTDRDGAATLSFAPGDLPRDVGGVRLLVSAPGYATWTSDLVRPEAPRPAELRVRLEEAHRLSGRVVAHDGVPAPGVLIRAIDGAIPPAELVDGRHVLPRAWERRDRANLGWTRSDEAGEFVLDALPAPPYHLIARVPGPDRGTAPEAWLTGVSPELGEPELVLSAPLPEGAHLEGRVIDAATGAPIEGCWVFLQDLDRRLQAKTDSAGTYRFAAALEGEFGLVARAIGYTPVTVPTLVLPRPGDLDFELERGARVEGHITTPPEVDALGPWVLGFTSVDGGPNLLAEANADGAYSLSGFAPGTYRTFLWVGAGNDRPYLTVPLGDRVVVGDGALELRHDVELQAGGRVHLMVAAVGRRARVGERVGNADGEPGWLEVVDDAGRVRLRRDAVEFDTATAHALPPGTYRVRLNVPGQEPVQTEVRVTPDSRELVELRARVY